MSLPVTLCGTPGPGLCFLPLETPDIEPEEFSTFQSVGDPVDKNVEGELAGTGAPCAEACGGKEPRAPDTAGKLRWPRADAAAGAGLTRA